ncbi:hypothetical protein GCM10023196_036870 [Actinoallomurus vinaceus]|uniref:Phage tail tape measure protein domain-containing protein n=1 Tax=Actinoallomurus vinaceus TaxID=1080074 RepID=A0ABP8U977_9ACTN
MSGELLPPAVQEYIADATNYLAGIDAMIAANTRLTESIAAVNKELRAMNAAAKKTGVAPGAAAGAGGADAAAEQAAAPRALGESARAAAEEETVLSEAEKLAAEAAQLEAEMTASLAREQQLLAEASKASAEAQKVLTASQKLGGEAAAAAAEKNTVLRATASSLYGGMQELGKGVLLAGAAFTAYGVKSAADFQTQIMRLKTSAGETGDLIGGRFTGNLRTASDALLKMSVETGTSTKELTAGMYMVSSAGYTVAKGGLTVMGVAARGARAEMAPLRDVTNALTTVMRDYNVQPREAARVMNAMTVTVGQGKMAMADFAAAISTVSPLAAQAHISFAELGGAMATLTQHGASAREATFQLAAVIRNLEKPNLQAVKEMDRLGISATDVSQNLGKRGLVGTLDMLTQAIARSMDKKSGQILISALNNSKLAAQNAAIALKHLPPDVQRMAKSFENGTITAKEWAKYVQGLPPLTANLASQFATASKRAHGFSDLLKSGSPLAQSYMDALGRMTGGTNAMRAALQLTGHSLQDTQENVKAVSAAWGQGGGSVKGFSDVQKTLNFQMAQAGQEIHAVAIQLGQMLLPVVTAVVGWLAKHTWAIKALAVILGTVAVAAVVALTAAIWQMNAALLANPITWIVLAVVAAMALVVGAIWYAWTRFAWFRSAVQAVWKAIKVSAEVVWRAIEAIFHRFTQGPLKWLQSQLKVFSNWWHRNGEEVKQVASETWRAVSSVVVTATRIWWDGYLKPTLTIMAGAWKLVWGIVVDALKIAWHYIRDVVTLGIHQVLDIIAIVMDLLTGKWGKAWSNVKKLASDTFKGTIKIIKDFASGFGNLLYDAGRNLIQGLINGIKSMASGAWNTMHDLIQGLRNYLPFSPAKVGPLSGRGDPLLSGMEIANRLATGMTANAHVVSAAADTLAAAGSVGIEGHRPRLTPQQKEAQRVKKLYESAAKKEKRYDREEDEWRRRYNKYKKEYEQHHHSIRYARAMKHVLEEMHKYAKLGAAQHKLYKQYHDEYLKLTTPKKAKPSLHLSGKVLARREYLAAMAAQQSLEAMRRNQYGGWFDGGPSTLGSSHGTVVQHITNVQVKVEGSVRADRDLVETVRKGLAQRSVYNAGNGASVPRRI